MNVTDQRRVETEPLDTHRFALGECARWDGRRLTVVDVHAGDLWTVGDDSRLHRMLHLPLPLGAANPVAGGGLILSAGTGVALLDVAGTVNWIAQPAVRPGAVLRMNDAAVDPAGNLWCGSMDETGTLGNGALYRIGSDRRASIAVTGLGCPNGPAFGADGAHMYLADSTRRVILRYSLDLATGVLGPAVEFASPPRGLPDGMAVDGDGVLWVALWGGSALARYAPDGTLLDLLGMPVRQPTSICFDGDQPVVTSARIGLTDPAPIDGAVLRLDMTVPPAPVAQFTFDENASTGKGTMP